MPATGFRKTVSLTCTVKFTGQGTATDMPTCSLNPGQLNVTSTSTVSTTVTINTTAKNAAASVSREFGWLAVSLATAFGLVLLGSGLPGEKRRRISLPLILAVVAAGTDCGGGGSNSGAGSGSGGNAGTTTGTYAVTVTGSSAGYSAPTTVNVTIQK